MTHHDAPSHLTSRSSTPTSGFRNSPKAILRSDTPVNQNVNHVSASASLMSRIEDFFVLRFCWLRELRYRIFFTINVQSAILFTLASNDNSKDENYEIQSDSVDFAIIRRAEHDNDGCSNNDVPIVINRKRDLKSVSKSYDHDKLKDDNRNPALIFKDSLDVANAIDERVMNVSSAFIRKFREDNQNTVPDRVSLLQELYELELSLHRSRVNLLEAYLFIYKHTTDVVMTSTIMKEMVSISKRDPVLTCDTIMNVVQSYNLLTKSFDDERILVLDVSKVAMHKESCIRNSIYNRLCTYDGHVSEAHIDTTTTDATNATSTTEADVDINHTIVYGVPPPLNTPLPPSINHMLYSEDVQRYNNDVYDSISLVAYLPAILRDVAKRVIHSYSCDNHKLMSTTIYHVTVQHAVHQWRAMKKDEIKYERQDKIERNVKQTTTGDTQVVPIVVGEDSAFDCVTAKLIVNSNLNVEMTERNSKKIDKLDEYMKLLLFSCFRVQLMNNKYESHVLTAAYAALSRRNGIRYICILSNSI